MSQLVCDSCRRLYAWYPIREGENYICGAHLGGRELCGSKLREHGCGGPREACGIPGCEECGGKPTPKRHQLSIEEVVYWLVVIGREGLACLVADREVEIVRKRQRDFSRDLRNSHLGRTFRRECGVLIFLLGEALRELEATKRPLSGKELAERHGFQPLKPEEFEGNVDREARLALRTGGQP